MMKECPFEYGNPVMHCNDKCMMYENGCLIKQALKCYITEHSQLKAPDPYLKTEAELYEMLMSIKPNIVPIDRSSIDDIPF